MKNHDPKIFLDVITNLAIDDRQNGRPAVAATDWDAMSDYFIDVCLSRRTLDAHIAHLEKCYQKRFVPFALRTDRQTHESILPPDSASGFPRSQLLSPAQVERILAVGPAGFCESKWFPAGKDRAFAEVLLNPYVLWDLCDLIATLLPDYWLDRMEERRSLHWKSLFFLGEETSAGA